jgi:hypothetical protein
LCSPPATGGAPEKAPIVHGGRPACRRGAHEEKPDAVSRAAHRIDTPDV